MPQAGHRRNGHKMYLKRLDRLTEHLTRNATNRVAISMIGREPQSQDLVFCLIEHLDGYCEKCLDDDRRVEQTLRIPLEEGLFLGRSMERLRKAYPGIPMSEILHAETLLCAIVRGVVLKYHPDRLAHEVMNGPGEGIPTAIDLALDRIYPALVQFG